MTATLVAAQGTAMGREIHRLAIHGDRLVLAYGDYAANTGPIHGLTLDLTDPGAALADEVTLHTEETYKLRVLNDGRLALPYADPQGYQDPTQGVAALRSLDGTWQIITNVTDHPPIHVGDLLRLADGTLVLSGSSQESPSGVACAWLSTDDGATWTWEQISTGVNEFERAYCLAELDGVLSAWVSNVGQPTQGRYERQGDGSWLKQDSMLAESTFPVTTLGHDYVWAMQTGPSSGVAAASNMVTFPTDLPTDLAAAVGTWPSAAYSMNVAADGSVWWLSPNGEVFQGKPDGTHRSLGTVDPTCRSIAADTDRGFVYFGTTDSRIVRAAIPA